MILGIDPGLECTGWCLLGSNRVCYTFDSIRTPATWSDERRITEICARLLAASRQAAVKVASVEQYVYQGKRSQNANAFRLSRLVGSIEGMFRGEGLTVIGPTRGQALASIGCRANSKEALAKRAIERLVRSNGGTLPPNEHTRAAYAAAWWAALRIRKEPSDHCVYFEPTVIDALKGKKNASVEDFGAISDSKEKKGKKQ